VRLRFLLSAKAGGFLGAKAVNSMLKNELVVKKAKDAGAATPRFLGLGRLLSVRSRA
jgi:hypothetical protein